MRILVADDDAINRRLLQASLVGWNYEVILARNGGEASPKPKPQEIVVGRTAI